jgi:hypothetical protein
VLDGFFLLTKGSSSINPLPPLLPLFRFGVTNDVAKPECILPVGDDGSSNKHSFSSKLIVEINEAQL